ncbi:MAG: DUF1080 domain-containing protein [Planctomycetaceae bacterium]|nr:DUF1080 domain-containing protein [Planctomycetaceae bacterium]
MRYLLLVFGFLFFGFIGISISEEAANYYPVRNFQTNVISYYKPGPKVPLFEDNLDQWTNTKGNPVPDGWQLSEGTLSRVDSAGDIVTKKEYEYFILEFEWSIAEKGNSGVKYRVRKIDGNYLGCEYQLLDDIHAAEKNLTASLYDVYAPNKHNLLKPVGEFNHSKIVVLGERIEHWLNGERVVLIYSGTPDWEAHIAGSKFNETKGFGENGKGKILIQDHGSEVHLRNMTIQEFRLITN